MTIRRIAAVLLGAIGAAVIAYVVIGYANVLTRMDDVTSPDPTGLIFAGAAASMLVTAWGVWHREDWARIPAYAMAIMAVLTGVAAIAYLALFSTLAPELAGAALVPLGGIGLVLVGAGLIVWRAAGAIRAD